MSLTKTRGRVRQEAILDEAARVDKANRAGAGRPRKAAAPMYRPAILCVRCNECDHRVALEGFADLSRAAIDRLPLRCKTCGSKSVSRIVPGSMDEAKNFLAGEHIMDFAK